MPRTSTTSYVYLIKEGDIHKIGRSRNPPRRLLEVAGPGASIVHLIPSKEAPQVELALQRRFAAKLVPDMGREWFALDQEDVDLICKIGPVRAVDDLVEELQVNLTNRSGVPLHVWIDPEINEALLAYLESTEPSVFKTAAVETALKDFLRSRGHWPRPSSSGGK